MLLCPLLAAVNLRNVSPCCEPKDHIVDVQTAAAQPDLVQDRRCCCAVVPPSAQMQHARSPLECQLPEGFFDGALIFRSLQSVNEALRMSPLHSMLARPAQPSHNPCQSLVLVLASISKTLNASSLVIFIAFKVVG